MVAIATDKNGNMRFLDENKKTINEDYELKGQDWSELLYKFNLKKESDDCGMTCDNSVQNCSNCESEKLKKFLGNNQSKENIEILKAFLKKMAESEYCNEGKKVWEAMIEIEDTYTFLQFFFLNLRLMWT
ncbi:MAG: hypothetical protein ACOCRX_06815 [Candidatus Woesearchaeota archaeon]